MLRPATLPGKWGIYTMRGWLGAIQLSPDALKVRLTDAPPVANWTLGKTHDSKVLGTYELRFTPAFETGSDNVLTVTIKDVASDQVIEEKSYGVGEAGVQKIRYLATGTKTSILFKLADPTPNAGSKLEVTNIGLNKTDFGDYRYGFNGKENDQEWGKLIQDYGFRLYNPAIAKFLSVDPLAPEYPWYTPYQFAGNTPIQAIDLDGLEPDPVNVSNRMLRDVAKIRKIDMKEMGFVIEASFAKAAEDYNSTVSNEVGHIMPSDIDNYNDWILKKDDNVTKNRLPDAWFIVSRIRLTSSPNPIDKQVVSRFWGVVDVKAGDELYKKDLEQAEDYATYLKGQVADERNLMISSKTTGVQVKAGDAGVATMWYILPDNFSYGPLKKIAKKHGVNLLISKIQSQSKKLIISKPEVVYATPKAVKDGIVNQFQLMPSLGPVDLQYDEGKKQYELFQKRHDKFKDKRGDGGK